MILDLKIIPKVASKHSKLWNLIRLDPFSHTHIYSPISSEFIPFSHWIGPNLRGSALGRPWEASLALAAQRLKEFDARHEALIP